MVTILWLRLAGAFVLEVSMASVADEYIQQDTNTTAIVFKEKEIEEEEEEEKEQKEEEEAADENIRQHHF